MNEIVTWLSGIRDYETGAKLYQRFGTSDLLKRVFKGEWTHFKEQKLQEAMQSMITVEKPCDEIKKHINQHSPEKAWPHEKDSMLQALWEKWKPVYSELMNLQARIYEVALLGKENKDGYRKAEARDMALRILQLDGLVESIYQQRDYYIKHGKAADDKEMDDFPTDAVEVLKLYKNAVRYVQEFKNKIRKDPANVKAAAKLSLHEKTVTRCKEFLKIK